MERVPPGSVEVVQGEEARTGVFLERSLRYREGTVFSWRESENLRGRITTTTVINLNIFPADSSVCMSGCRTPGTLVGGLRSWQLVATMVCRKPFYSCFDQPRPQTYIMKVRADVILGGDPIHNSLFLSLGSEPREREEWQAAGGRMSAQSVQMDVSENSVRAKCTCLLTLLPRFNAESYKSVSLKTMAATKRM